MTDQTDPIAKEHKFSNERQGADDHVLRGLDDLSRAWLEHCYSTGVPATTISRRAQVLRQISDPGTATRAQLEQWSASRSELKPATRRTDIGCLRSFYAWVNRLEDPPRLDNPASLLVLPKAGHRLPKVPSEADVRKLLAATVDQDPEMHRAFALAAGAGLRAAEITALTWAGVDLENRRLTFVGKGNKERVVGIGAGTLARLGDPQNPDCSVLTGTTDHWEPTRLSQRAVVVMHRNDVRSSLHKLRHRFATLGYREKRDLRGLQELLGHANITTTAIYARANPDALEEVASATDL